MGHGRKTFNIQHSTSNVQVPTENFEVGRSMLNVGCLSEIEEVGDNGSADAHGVTRPICRISLGIGIASAAKPGPCGT